MKKTKKLNRREFIKLSTAASGSIPFVLSGFPLFANEKPDGYVFEEENDNILVLIQLQGGNDGLNTVFDLNQYTNLQSVRSNIIIPKNDLLTINDTTRFHPSLTGMKEIWDQEKLSIIQNVGYPDQNRSHFRSTDIWNSASSATAYVSSGWIGRLLDGKHSKFPENYPNEENPDPFAITIGTVISETCQGTNANFSMALADPDNPGTALVSNTGEIPSNCYGNALKFVNDTISQTNAYAAVIKKASAAGNNLSTKYTDSNLSKKLKDVAKLISGGLKSKVYIVQIGGFDNHHNQIEEGEPTTGKHAELLQELSDAIAAFQNDIELLDIDKKVVGMTYSEFGRRIRSNAAFGTDHGTAAPLFMFGSCVKNQILGDAPEIDTQVDEKEGVQMQHDFRNIYSTVLTDWLGATKAESTAVLFSEFDSLPIFKSGCSASLSNENFLLDNVNINVYPNPTIDFVNIQFLGTNNKVTLVLYNSIGAVVKQITNTTYNAAQHTIKVDTSRLPKGNYFIYYHSNGVSKTKKLLKF
ncbi:putative secreted protein (Por secretion system target) [Lutibacter sp. Hel_I_33_5]|uniref:DUF1501 domain-containing protein n=1 Tax=Lutibacter sp. Hel_I_33_5 TaxID=1566289 RepID=UPI0011A0C7A7|nr:DUF1501 domain-containing protein [Lutibacter sp. Hel_I_33_5]TVZ56024.1 putative secreted protein (Por secretion system target) [Lutibacter sp. Hel_I_33_5]